MAKKEKQPKARTANDVMRKAVWSPDENFILKGSELEALSRLAEAFAPLVNIPTSIIRQADLEGKLQYEYSYTDGAKVPIHIVNEHEEKRKAELERNRKMIEEYNNALNAKLKKVAEDMEKGGSDEVKDTKPTNEQPTPVNNEVEGDSEKEVKSTS